MKGFHISASGAIQGHHGPLVTCPSKMGSITGSPIASGLVDRRHPHSLSEAYLQDYASYGYEISWVEISSRRSAVHRNHNSSFLNF